jgi:mono/diheme cytochrome c family protein
MRCYMVGSLLMAVALAGCEGSEGPMGPAGMDGTDGTSGTPGIDWPGPAPPAYIAADGILGGAAYSKWWTTEAAGSGTQPATTAGADFYRCKACHAWDGLGSAASYATRTGQSTLKPTRPDVSGVNLRSTAASESFQELFDLIERSGARDVDASDNTHPDYSARLSTAQLWNIVKFMREEWVAPSELYDIAVSGPAMYVDYSQIPPAVVTPTITYSNIGAKGNDVDGDDIFGAVCATCHGVDGRTLDLGGRSLGQFVREKPNEAWFKAKFGEAGTGMTPGLVTSLVDLQDLYAALVNATRYPDL